jgi:hypothetical protein
MVKGRSQTKLVSLKDLKTVSQFGVVDESIVIVC